ncbi:MAG: hypothetical protein FJ291_03490 [Planctomycetes bacterium]|nr:hypothetical protein [Planctomycetota bacterium]
MIELSQDALVFRFPRVHPHAVLCVNFQRTLRIPDDDKEYPLPPGLGRFPLRLVDACPARVPPTWLERGGVVLPMYQSEAMWLSFSSPEGYPFALKVAAGRINAVTGEAWRDKLHRKPQDYVAIPTQPWLDGYCVAKGVIRQFVAMPLGAGYTAEEQLTGKAEHGGVQLVAYPIKREVYRRMLAERRRWRARVEYAENLCMAAPPAAEEMGLAPGGKMRQEIYDDPQKWADWDREHFSRCCVHIANSLTWHQATGEWPPHPAPTAKEYTDAGFPWFDYYSDAKALDGSAALAGLKSVAQLGKEKGQVPLPENQPVVPQHIIKLRSRLRPNQVREW